MIRCAIHDYVEIACLYHLQVRLTLQDQQQIEGRAETTLTGADKKEYLQLSSGTESIKIDLESIKKMQALTPNPHFDLINF